MLLVEVWGGGDNEQALAYGQGSLAIARELHLTEQVGFTQTNLVNVYWNLGLMEEAGVANLEARAAWQETGNMPMLADSYGMTQLQHWYRAEFKGMIASGEEAIRHSQAIGNTWSHTTAILLQSNANVHLGEIGQALVLIEAGKELGREIPISTFKYGSVHFQARAYLALGAFEEAGRLADYLNTMWTNWSPTGEACMKARLCRSRSLKANWPSPKCFWPRPSDTFRRMAAQLTSTGH
ncbi:MAG TPA: hypothetical protein VLE70_09820 [Anaerolineae bacterium]|nr:hypothetical protein [Anaerolineae bacterium]